MNKLLLRYVLKTTILATLLVLFSMTMLFSLFTLLAELNDVGVADYDVQAMFTFLLFTMPRRMVEIMPVSCLVGCLIALGQLSNASELTAMRAAGVSVARIARIAVGCAMVFALMSFVLGEYVVPDAQMTANKLRASATRSIKEEQMHRKNIWIKKHNEFAKIEFVSVDHELLGVHIYQFDDDFRLLTYTHAASGLFKTADIWALKNVVQTQFLDRKTASLKRDSMDWRSLIEVESLGGMVDEPNQMSIRDLGAHLRFLKSVGENDKKFELAYWQKIILPFSTIAMVLLALPLVFSSNRQTPLTQRVFAGVLIGLVFNIVTKGIGYVGLAYGLNLFVLTLLPPLIVGAFAVFALSRVR